MGAINVPGRETMTVPEAARRLGISRGHAYALAAEGNFPAPIIKAGNRILVSTAGLDRALGLEPELAVRPRADGS